MRIFEVPIRIEISDDYFEEHGRDPERLLWAALEHGDASGEFSSYAVGEIAIVDTEETE